MAEAALAPVTVRDALARAAARLATAGCETPRLDAELLLGRVLGVDRSRLVIDARTPIDTDALERFHNLVHRRERREPVAYILGERAFRRLTLAVDARVLIPRPETELLIDVGVTLPPGARVADVGTGSGAVALALKDERPDLLVTGLERDPGALEVARMNGQRLGLDVEWVVSDLLGERVFDAVLANLPYVADGIALAPEITAHEPAGALFAGADGLAAIRRLAAQAGERPAVSLLALEIGAGQADAVSDLLLAAGFDAVSRHRDLAGHERVIVGRR